MSKINRRKILKGGALALPVAWSAPVIETVILPAHAQTSCQTEGFPEFSVTCTSSNDFIERQVICTTIEGPDGCLQTNCVPVESLTLEPNQIGFLERIDNEHISLVVDDSNDRQFNRYWNCQTETIDDSNDEPLNVTVAGTNYTLIYEFGVNNATSTIFIRNIALVPA